MRKSWRKLENTMKRRYNLTRGMRRLSRGFHLLNRASTEISDPTPNTRNERKNLHARLCRSTLSSPGRTCLWDMYTESNLTTNRQQQNSGRQSKLRLIVRLPGCSAWALGYQQPPDAEGAERAAREALRLQPGYTAAYYQLGRALLLQERYDEAFDAFQLAWKLDPDFQAIHIGIAQVYLAQGDYKRALTELQKMKTTSAVAIVVLSSIYAAQGEKESALAELERALSSGYRDFVAIDANPYLSSLRPDPRFQQLLQRFR